MGDQTLDSIIYQLVSHTPVVLKARVFIYGALQSIHCRTSEETTPPPVQMYTRRIGSNKNPKETRRTSEGTIHQRSFLSGLAAFGRSFRRECKAAGWLQAPTRRAASERSSSCEAERREIQWMVAKSAARTSDGFNHGFQVVRNGFCPSTV